MSKTATAKTTTLKPDEPNPARKSRVDPEIVKIRKKYNEEVKDYLRIRASHNLLKTIIEKRLPKLVGADREKLLDTLMANTTRCFPAMLNKDGGPMEDHV